MNKPYAVAGLVAVLAITACASQSSQPWQSDHYSPSEGFFNQTAIEQDFSLGRFFTIAKRFFFEKQANTEPFGLIPVETIEPATLTSQQGDVVYRLGHSTILMKLSGKYILTDPMFSQRTSPVQWVGPERFHPVPIDPASLPNIYAVVISHDHYDHLDEGSIKLLAANTQHFYVPLGLKTYLLDWGVSAEKIHEMDWWQQKALGGFTFTSTPSQHFSGRGLFNRNGTLWSSWVIQSPKQRIFFSGDSGYFDGFKTIGDKFGPFDLTILENGAYNPDWPQVHMFPAETIQAHIDLKGKAMLPVHNGTFKLSFHPWKDPLEKVASLGEAQGLMVYTPKMGEAVTMDIPAQFEKWWQLIADE